MTGIEIALLVIGCVFMIGSFFVSEKLSNAEIGRLAELSDEELKRIIDKGMKKAGDRIEQVVEEKVETVSEKAEVAMERESNLKIMAIGEYSDTVIESMKKTHDEIMFLYSMLNDKHTEMTSLTGDLQRLAANVRNLQETDTIPTVQTAPASGFFAEEKKAEAVEKDFTDNLIEAAEQAVFGADEDLALENHNDRILALYKEGMSKVEIARTLNLGVGEVSLVIGLYKGDGQ